MALWGNAELSQQIYNKSCQRAPQRVCNSTVILEKIQCAPKKLCNANIGEKYRDELLNRTC